MSEGPAPPDDDAVREMREQVDRLSEAAAALRELGEREGFPAVEKNAGRVEGVVRMLETNLPPELLDDREE